MNCNTKYIILGLLLNFKILSGQNPLLDSIEKRGHIDDLIDSLHFSPTTFKNHQVKELKVFVKDSYYSKDNDSLYLMKKVEYNKDGYKIKSYENNFENKPHVYGFERDKNNCLLLGYEFIGDKKNITERFEYQNGLLISEIRRFTFDTNKKTTYKHDSKGNLIEENEYCFDEINICSSIKYQYDSSNRIKQITRSTNNDSIFNINQFNYDSLSRLIEVIEKSKNSSEIHHKYQYTIRDNELEILINDLEEKKVLIINSKEWRINEYDGKKVEEVTTIKFTQDGKVTEVIREWPLRRKSPKKRQLFCGFIPPKYQKVVVSYNVKGQLVSKKEFSSQTKYYMEIKYEYNENGLLSKETEYEEGKLDDIWFYEYNYW